MITSSIDRAVPDRGIKPAATDTKVSARLWLYPPRRHLRNVSTQAIIAAARAGVDIEIGDVSIGIEGTSHNVFAAIEQIFNGVGDEVDVAFVATMERGHQPRAPVAAARDVPVQSNGTAER